ncbi:MAG TPA: FtsW/RodA/SpoVE family cell cycle protein [Vicinamibacterales bacterium]|nr:FtsW/RodA/SpoVE family cell cycle protein [Vicinamibacterales bacterium]
MTIFTWLCAASSVALGSIFMFAAGAPRQYIIINIAALVVGFFVAVLMSRGRVPDARKSGAMPLIIGTILLATALFGVQIDGATRWFRIAGLSIQPSLILLPLALMQFARNRRWLSSVGLMIASVGLAMQPDRAMSGTLAAGLAALWLQRREAPVTVALAAALFGFAGAMLKPDVVPPVLFVEQVVRSAFAFHVQAGIVIVAGLLILLLPAAAMLGPRTKESAVFAVFGATWLAVVAFALIGNYPTPLVGYGSSAIIGYCVSAARLPR